MELFDEIVECEVGVVTPHLSDLIQFGLQVASNTLLGDNIRVKALSFLQWLASLKKKVRRRIQDSPAGWHVMCVPPLELAEAGAPSLHHPYHVDHHGHALL